LTSRKSRIYGSNESRY